MLYLVGQIFFCLALVAMVGLLVGWLLRGIGTHQRERELEATWRMRLRQRDTMLSKMATQLAERETAEPAGDTRKSPGHGLANDLNDARKELRASQALVAQLQGRVSKRDAQLSHLFSEIRRIGGQPAVEKLLEKVNEDSFLASGMHRAADLAPAGSALAPARENDVSEATHPEKASLQSSTTRPDPAAENDELVFIYGVSPALEKKLFKIGITTYRQIAGFGPQDIQRIARTLGIEPDQIINENWVEGARQEHLAKYGELT